MHVSVNNVLLPFMIARVYHLFVAECIFIAWTSLFHYSAVREIIDYCARLAVALESAGVVCRFHHYVVLNVWLEFKVSRKMIWSLSSSENGTNISL